MYQVGGWACVSRSIRMEKKAIYIAICWELNYDYSVLSPCPSHVDCTVRLILMQSI